MFDLSLVTMWWETVALSETYLLLAEHTGPNGGQSWFCQRFGGIFYL